MNPTDRTLLLSFEITRTHKAFKVVTKTTQIYVRMCEYEYYRDDTMMS